MKHFILISKKTAGYFLLGGLALIALLFLLRSAGLPAEVSGAIKKDNPIYFVYTDENKISLSFDAAWGLPRNGAKNRRLRSRNRHAQRLASAYE